MGDSMSPALEDGDLIIAIQTQPRTLRAGLIYVIEHSDLGRIIKRLGAPSGEGFMLIGDNPASTPSAVIGPVEPARITRRAIMRVSPKGISRL